ncbi:hypothetical protein L9F63_025537 [Diploptera punctata]|uniref:BTB domain-containing protein n=1 Tax=Diploptera punctata TaxID=6984 RepID=A0AAD8E4J6_DIPPU|nr:hypothetical protein L9F63_025537 [Diploptera punctata]
MQSGSFFVKERRVTNMSMNYAQMKVFTLSLVGSDAMVEQLQQNEVASSGGLVFEDEQHSSRTMQSLNMMRKNKHFCDVILHVGNMEFHAHRAVLASASPHLFELFTADDETKGSQRENIITYKLNGGYDRLALEKLIHYAYTARLEVNNSQVKAVYLAACHLKMDRVVRECIVISSRT